MCRCHASDVTISSTGLCGDVAQVGPPKVITQEDAKGHKLEPYEEAVVEVCIVQKPLVFTSGPAHCTILVFTPGGAERSRTKITQGASSGCWRGSSARSPAVWLHSPLVERDTTTR